MAYQIQNGVIINAPQAFSGAITPNSVAGIVGTTAGDNAQAGSDGEYLTSNDNFAVAGITATMTTASPTVVTCTGSNLPAGAPVYFTNSGGAIGTGMVVSTNYYVTKGTNSANSFSLSTTLANALAGTANVNVTVAGTGTQTAHAGAIMATTVAADIGSIFLQPGDYDVDAIVVPAYGGSTSVTSGTLWFGTAGGSSLPATSGALLTAGATQFTSAAVVAGAQVYQSGTFRVNISSAGMVVLSANFTFTASTLELTAFLRARRVR